MRDRDTPSGTSVVPQTLEMVLLVPENRVRVSMLSPNIELSYVSSCRRGALAWERAESMRGLFVGDCRMAIH